MAAQALMKRGKRAVATYFRAECSRASGNQQLNELLDHLLDVSKLPTDPEILDWLRWLIAGGTTFDEFSRTVNQFDNATTCGLVWTANFVAYRCRTCGISPCMSLCSDCFQAGNHTGHDYNMFRSQAGGACDCGDTSVMKACGFCPRHGPDRVRERSGPPPELLATAEAMMPRLLFRLIQHLRLSSAQDSMNSVRDPVKEIEGYMDYLHSLSDMGAAMRHIITKTVTNTELYTSLCQGEGVSNPEIKAHLKRSQDLYKQTLGTLNSPRIPKDFQDMKALSSPLVHQTLLDELLFWTVKLEFPQLMVTFLLSILPDSDYKEAFTISFVKHYSRMSIVLVNTTEWPTISNRVVHISVQLLSPENLAMQMVEEHHLLYLMTICLEYMMKFILTDSTLHEASNNFHMVVDCSQTVMREHCYWPIVSDLINVLSHRPIAYKFMSNERLLKFWFELISYFQGMNLNQRELQRHVEYEPDTYYAAFSAELEICSSPMWSMLVHCPSQDTVEYTKKIINMVIIALRDWFLAIGCRPFMTPNPLQLTFHLPLHRYLAVFLGHAVRNQGMELMDMLPSQDFLQLLIIHPLQIQMCLHQIFANMWVRNGLQIRGQAMTYIQCHFCNSMVDADIFLLQVCACKLDPDFFIKTVLDRFSVLELFSLADHAGEPLPTKNTFLQPEHMIPMLEGALTCLVSLLSIRTNLGMTEEELACLEMITLLCMSDRTHSQLMDYMPEKCGLHGQTKNFEPTLKKVAEYKAPNFEPGGGMQQGMYVPKGEVWEDLYDPVYVLLRAVHRRDFQQSMDRYTTYVKQAGLYKGSGSPWPPFRLPGRVEQPFVCLRRLLHSRSMHALIFILLYKAVNESKLSETVVYLCCYLLEMAITTPAVTAKSTVVSSAGTPRDKELSTWYASDNIFTNLQVTVEGVTVKVRNHEPPEEELTDDMDFVSDLSHSSLHPPSLKQLVVSAPRPSTSSSHSPGVSTSGSSSSTAAQTATQTPMPGGSIVQSGEDVVSAIEQLMDQAIQSLGNTCRERPQFTQNKGVSASLGEHVKKASVKLEESILSLLCKLHKKLSGNSSVYVPESIRGSASFEKDSRIGDGPFFIAKMLDRAARLSSSCSAVLEDIYRESQPRHTAKMAALDPEEKKRRARARQQKLMAEFASKQKQFMEQLADESGNLDDDGSSGASVSEPVETQEQTYDCVICNQTTPSTQDKPMALVTLLQSTSVLGHRVRMSEGSSEPIPDGTRGTFKTCAEEQLLHHERLFQHFQQVSVLLATSIGWEGGVHAQSCGHYVHLDCHKSYMESLLGEQAQQQNLLVSQGEFLCPLCRKLSNSVVAIVPDLGQAIAVPVPSDQTEMVLRIADILQNRPVTHNSSTVTRAMGSVMEDLTNATYPQFRNYTSSQTTETILLFVSSFARTNLELEIMLEKLGDKTLVPGSRKQSLLPLLHVLGLHYRLLATNTSVYKDLWLQVTGVTREQQSNEVAPYLKKVPLLLTDPCALLVQLVLSMPPTMEVEYFQCIVQALYNLAYIQALIVMSCKFSPEERTAWSGKAKEVGLEGLMSLVVQQLTGSELYRDITPDPHIPAITHVWSPQSVECTIQQHCLPYLRLATHLQCHLYGQPLPVTEEKLGEYLSLCQHAGLCRDGVTMDTSGASSVRWLCSEPVALIQAWSGPFLEFVNSNITSARMLLMCEPMWQPPRLCHLPRQYDRIFQYYRKKQCTKCNTLPHDPALCLMCARVLCFKHVCCAEQGVHECVKHSVSCGGGTGILLIVNSSLIVVIRGPRATVWGSVYLDEFGEEDRDLKRGKPLYLSEERYKVLQQQWLAHSFDQMCKRWIFHNDRL